MRNLARDGAVLDLDDGRIQQRNTRHSRVTVSLNIKNYRLEDQAGSATACSCKPECRPAWRL